MPQLGIIAHYMYLTPYTHVYEISLSGRILSKHDTNQGPQLYASHNYILNNMYFIRNEHDLTLVVWQQ